MESKNHHEIKEVASFLEDPFQRGEKNLLYGYTRLSHDLDLTKHYKAGLFPVPRAPLFHPYHPNENPEPAKFSGIPATTVSLRCPKESVACLPLSIQEQLKKLNNDTSKLDLFFVTQNMPWKAGSQLLIRPHYWVHGNPDTDKAVEANTFSVDTPCRVGVFTSREVKLELDTTQNTIIGPISVNSHPGEGMIICSPDNVGVVKGLDFNQTQSFYSLVVTPDGRAAVTLHWMLSPADQQRITNISNDEDITNLLEFITVINSLEKSQLNAENGPLQELKRFMNILKPDDKELKETKFERTVSDETALQIALAESLAESGKKDTKSEKDIKSETDKSKPQKP